MTWKTTGPGAAAALRIHAAAKAPSCLRPCLRARIPSGDGSRMLPPRSHGSGCCWSSVNARSWGHTLSQSQALPPGPWGAGGRSRTMWSVPPQPHGDAAGAALHPCTPTEQLSWGTACWCLARSPPSPPERVTRATSKALARSPGLYHWTWLQSMASCVFYRPNCIESQPGLG